MTILGVAAGRESGVVWADTLVACRGQPHGEASKLAVNAMARTIGTGAGMQAVLRHGDLAVLDGDDLDSIVPTVATALRAAAVRLVGREGERGSDWFSRNVYLVCGFSLSAGRVMAYEGSTQHSCCGPQSRIGG